MRKHLYWIISASLLAAGCAPLQPDELTNGLNDVYQECSKQTFATMEASAACYDEHEKWVWIKYAPLYQAYFQSLKNERDSLAARFDAKQISMNQFLSDFNAFKQQLYIQLKQQAAQDEVTRREQANQLADALLAGVAACSKARADADAAAIRTIQQNKVQHTTCDVVFGQLQCTTTTQ